MNPKGMWQSWFHLIDYQLATDAWSINLEPQNTLSSNHSQ